MKHFLIALLITGCSYTIPVIPEPVSVTIDFYINPDDIFYPVVWIKEGTQQFPTPYRMFDWQTQEYLGPVTIITDSSMIYVNYSKQINGIPVQFSDSLKVKNDTLWTLNREGK